MKSVIIILYMKSGNIFNTFIVFLFVCFIDSHLFSKQYLGIIIGLYYIVNIIIFFIILVRANLPQRSSFMTEVLVDEMHSRITAKSCDSS